MWESPSVALTRAAGTQDPDDRALVFLLFFGSHVSGLPQMQEYSKEPTQSIFPLRGPETPSVPEPSQPWESAHAAILVQTLNRSRGAWSSRLSAEPPSA